MPHTLTATASIPLQREVEIATGKLLMTIRHTDMPLDTLLGFASRRNKKRGFLFVSNVLGRHVPVRASTMYHTHRLLAGKIPSDLPGPVVFVGMAETAIALGHGVHDEYVARTGRNDSVFIHTTRYPLSLRQAVTFLEEHSHAPSHLLYEPVDPVLRDLFLNAESLVLVDDEASTGKTFINLAKVLKKAMPKLKRVVTAVLTDWRNEASREVFRQTMPVQAEAVSILDGEYAFHPDENVSGEQAPNAIGHDGLRDDVLVRNYGRLGAQNAPRLEHRLSRPHRGERILVLGTGEFAYAPYRLARELEDAGAEVYCQSTTRSPVSLGGAIGCRRTFRDNYGDGIDNYVYNVRTEEYDRIIICCETPAASLDRELVGDLNAHIVEG